MQRSIKFVPLGLLILAAFLLFGSCREDREHDEKDESFCSDSGSILMCEDFQSLMEGDRFSERGWTVESGYFGGVNRMEDEGNVYLQLVSLTPEAFGPTLIWRLDQTIHEGIVTAEISLKKPGDGFFFHMVDETEERDVGFYAEEELIQVGGTVCGDDPILYEWTQVKVILDFETRKYSILIDNELGQCTECDMLLTPFGSLASIRLGYGSVGAGDTDIDNIKVVLTQVP